MTLRDLKHFGWIRLMDLKTCGCTGRSPDIARKCGSLWQLAQATNSRRWLHWLLRMQLCLTRWRSGELKETCLLQALDAKKWLRASTGARYVSSCCLQSKQACSKIYSPLDTEFCSWLSTRTVAHEISEGFGHVTLKNLPVRRKTAIRWPQETSADTPEHCGCRSALQIKQAKRLTNSSRQVLVANL